MAADHQRERALSYNSNAYLGGRKRHHAGSRKQPAGKGTGKEQENAFPCVTTKC